MEHRGEVFISTNFKKEDFNRLNLSNDSNYDSWCKAIKIFNDRISGRYIEPIVRLIDEDTNAYGFTAMAIDCLLIETLYQFRNGIDKTHERKNKSSYSLFLDELLKNHGIVDSYTIAEKFYTDIRCGILHQGQTNNGSKLTTSNEAIIKYDNGVLLVSVKKFTECIISYFENYKIKLLDKNETDVRENFIVKMNYICGNRNVKRTFSCQS